MPHAADVPEFSFSTFIVQFRARTRVLLPINSGSTFHGAFGNAFHRIECSRPEHDCPACYLRDECLYYRYFSRTDQGKKQPVRPYIIEAPPGAEDGFQPGERLSFLFTLVGESLQHLLRFFPVFEAMGKQGMGKGRQSGMGRCDLEAVYNLNDEAAIPVYPRSNDHPWPPDPVKRRWSEFARQTDEPVDKVGIQFLTPARIQHRGKLIDNIPFHILVARLLNRISDLDREYCGGVLNIPVRMLVDLAEKEVEIAENRTTWRDWERYSARQKSRMKFGGVIGEIIYRGNLGPFVPYLLLGEYVHVGKQATFGNGVVKMNFL